MTFDEAFDLLLGHEGGYVNNPADPGGETNWGISKRQYPDLDIRNLTRAQAKKIYQRDYWDRLQAGALPEAIQFDLFDCAINSGLETAARLLQRAVGTAEDGMIGPLTIAAVNTLGQWEVRAKFNARRLQFMTDLSTWPTFGRGWARRIANNLRR